MLGLFRQLTIYLAPVLPRLAEQTGELFDDPITSWDQAKSPIVGRPINKFKHMMQRIDPKKIEAMIEEGREIVKGHDKWIRDVGELSEKIGLVIESGRSVRRRENANGKIGRERVSPHNLSTVGRSPVW